MNHHPESDSTFVPEFRGKDYGYHMAHAVETSITDLVSGEGLNTRFPTRDISTTELQGMVPFLAGSTIHGESWEPIINRIIRHGDILEPGRFHMLCRLAEEQASVSALEALNLLQTWGFRARSGSPVEPATIDPAHLDNRGTWYAPEPVWDRLREARDQIQALLDADAVGTDWIQFMPEPEPLRQSPSAARGPEKNRHYEVAMFEDSFAALHTAAMKRIRQNTTSSMSCGAYGLRGGIVMNAPELDQSTVDTILKAVPTSRFTRTSNVLYTVQFALPPDDLPNVSRSVLRTTRNMHDEMKRISHRHYRDSVRWGEVRAREAKRLAIEFLFFSVDDSVKFMNYAHGVGTQLGQVNGRVVVHFDNNVEYNKS